MEELKLLTEMVAGLPSMALWVIALFFAYKVVCVGSIYGVIRFCVEKWYLYKITPKHELIVKELRPTIDGMCIKAETESFIAQLNRIRGKGCGFDTEYIHKQSVNWLREAIDEKIVKDAKG